MLSYRCSVKTDIGHSPAELALGTQLRIPGEFFVPSDLPPVTHGYVNRLASYFDQLQPPRASRHCHRQTLLHKDLVTCTHVFIRDPTAVGLEPAYTGPFPVKKKFDNYFIVNRRNNPCKVSVEQLKPAFILNDSTPPAPQLTYSHLNPVANKPL